MRTTLGIKTTSAGDHSPRSWYSEKEHRHTRSDLVLRCSDTVFSHCFSLKSWFRYSAESSSAPSSNTFRDAWYFCLVKFGLETGLRMLVCRTGPEVGCGSPKESCSSYYMEDCLLRSCALGLKRATPKSEAWWSLPGCFFCSARSSNLGLSFVNLTLFFSAHQFHCLLRRGLCFLS